jgi:hypothetical protein
MDPEDYEGTASLLLPRSLEAWGTGHFKQVLKEELEEMQDELPIGSEGGGWLADWSVEVEVNSAKRKGDEIRATVMALYESERSSSCADITHTSSHRADLSVVIDRESGEATVEVTDHEELRDEDDEDDDVDFGDSEE